MGGGDAQSPRQGLAWLYPQELPYLLGMWQPALQRDLKGSDCQVEFCFVLFLIALQTYYFGHFHPVLKKAL